MRSTTLPNLLHSTRMQHLTACRFFSSSGLGRGGASPPGKAVRKGSERAGKQAKRVYYRRTRDRQTQAERDIKHGKGSLTKRVTRPPRNPASRHDPNIVLPRMLDQHHPALLAQQQPVQAHPADEFEVDALATAENLFYGEDSSTQAEGGHKGSLAVDTAVASIPLDRGITVADVVALLRANKGQDVVVVDMREKVDDVQYLVLATGLSSTHLRSMTHTLLTEMKKRKKFHTKPVVDSKKGDPDWHVFDAGLWTVHLMSAETRARFDLESVWVWRPPKGDPEADEFLSEEHPDPLFRV